MAFDRGLAERVREQFRDRDDVEEKKMFGGLCFMVADHMCCGIVGDTLMARVGAENYQACLTRPHVREMDFTGRALKSMVYIAPSGIEDDPDLARWITICDDFVKTLPPKKTK